MKTSTRTPAAFSLRSSLSLRFAFLAPCVLGAALTLAAPRATAAESAFKPEDGFGVGFVLGSPSGLSGSLPMNGGTRAINGVLGWDIGHSSALFAQADYVFVRGDLFDVEHGKVSLYYGPGAFAVLSSSSAVGIRFVGGVDYRFEGVPLQAFLEIGPGINVLPNTSATAGGGLGLRYYF
jgi:hypothetical protein